MPDQPTELGLGFPQFGRPKLQQILNRDTAHRNSPQNPDQQAGSFSAATVMLVVAPSLRDNKQALDAGRPKLFTTTRKLLSRDRLGHRRRMMADDFPLTVFLVIHVRVTSLHLRRLPALNDIEGVDALIYGRVVAEASDMDFVQGALWLQFKEMMEVIDNQGRRMKSSGQ